MIASPDTVILLLLWTIMQPLGARPPCPLSLRRPCFTIAFAQCSQTVCEIWLYHNAYSGRAAARGSVCSWSFRSISVTTWRTVWRTCCRWTWPTATATWRTAWTTSRTVNSSRRPAGPPSPLRPSVVALALNQIDLKRHFQSINQSIIYSFIKSSIKWQCTIGERDMQGSVRALKAAPKLHNYNSTWNINSDTQK